ncbi:unnamed protein product, partial [Coregonus sp. 'balchen']
EQIPEGLSSLGAMILEPKEPPVEHPLPADDDLDTPTSNTSVDPKAVELGSDQADTPGTPDTPGPQLPPAPQPPPVLQIPLVPDNPSLKPSPLTNGQHSSESLTTPITTIVTTNTLPPPYNNTNSEPQTEKPEGQNSTYTLPDPPFPGLGGGMCAGYGSLSRGGVHQSSLHTYWPSRNYQPQPGGHYTLPLLRDIYGQVGLTNQTEREGPGDATLGGIHQLRPITTMELLREPSRTRGGYEEALMSQMDGDPISFFQAMSRAQMLQFPHKRSSMVSLDSIRKDPRWRDPNLSEVITMLSHPMDPVKSNAAAYLQHLCYENDHIKQDVRQLKGVPVLVGLLDHPKAEVHRKACGALRNISYGKDHHNKVAIKNCEGIPALVRLLRKSSNMEVRELVTGTLWNLSSHEPLKMMVINHGLQTLTDEVIIPHSGWRRDLTEHSRPQETEWTTVFKNTSGCLRNVSSDGAEARQRLRECEGLVDALLHALQSAVGNKETDNKSVENCVCILRNLSYHVHKEVPGAERFQEPVANQVPRSGSGGKKKNEADCWRNGPTDKKYGTLDLPKRTQPTKAKNLEGDTVVAILNTIHEIISDSPENTRGLIQGHGIQKLVAINKTSQSVRDTKAASQVLQTVWAYKELRNLLYRGGWNKSHFKSTTSGMPKRTKSGKSAYDDIILPLMEKNQDGYSTVEQSDRVGDGLLQACSGSGGPQTSSSRLLGLRLAEGIIVQEK